ncbi:hypothetical protein [Sinanaerobacter sp. ZZT-01]|uniref:hypothetical protein n=1 Tax=Sinanaerobacter sp. ZZT-01 TaxID=3111540 RepID=UPI002D7A0A59|nr:hypothetical protein [Sinanaerobacter sp. ZZT-01]WRR94308.1 hypothetical protein U5921_04075 [Sinanaerobacter sp. ZZT-01]
MFVLLTMIFLHIVDDFYLQGWLAKGKQKEWWQINAPQPMYQYDYLCALGVHAFSWTFMIMFPIIVVFKFRLNLIFLIFFIINCAIHFIIDHLKANAKMINLMQDQAMHLLQLIITYSVLLRPGVISYL